MNEEKCPLTARELYVLEEMTKGRKVADIRIEGAGRFAAYAALRRVRNKLELEDQSPAVLIATAFRKGWLT